MKGYAIFAVIVVWIAVFVTTPGAKHGGGSPVEHVLKAPAAPMARSETMAPVAAMVSTGEETVIPRSANGHFYATARVNGQPVNMVVDTGATSVALTIADARQLGLSFDPAAFQVIGSGASGPVRGVGVTLNDIEIGGKHASNVEAAVVEGLQLSLLGQSYLRRLDHVDISGDTMRLR
jgi:aspartyl protease family protein